MAMPDLVGDRRQQPQLVGVSSRHSGPVTFMIPSGLS